MYQYWLNACIEVYLLASFDDWVSRCVSVWVNEWVIEWVCVLGRRGKQHVGSLVGPLEGSPLQSMVWSRWQITWQRQTMSASLASMSTTFPLPSSPHWAPRTTVTRFWQSVRAFFLGETFTASPFISTDDSAILFTVLGCCFRHTTNCLRAKSYS